MPHAIRIEAARVALARAAWSRGQVPQYDVEVVIDLLADIRHLCTVANIDFDRCDHLAEIHFESETGGAS